VRLHLVPFACLAAAACGGPDPCPAAFYDDVIDVPATDAVLTVDARVSAHTATPTDGISIAIDDNLGTVTFPGETPIPAFVYERTFLAGVQRNLYQGLAVADGSWRPFWFYCLPDGGLWYFYGEGSGSSSAAPASVSGPCSETPGPFDLHVQLPAHQLRHVNLTCGFSIEDANPAYFEASFPRLSVTASKPGAWWRDNELATLLMFTAADCSEGCRETGSWYELHSLFWEATAQRLGFGVWYLRFDNPSTPVSVSNGLFLPDLAPFSDVFPDATWMVAR
jgi:hypothetical protein